MMTWQVRGTAEIFNSTLFGGKGMRRVPIELAGVVLHLLLHEDDKSRAFLLGRKPNLTSRRAAPEWASITLNAEWGEPLGQVLDVQVDDLTGEIQAYLIGQRYKGDAGNEWVEAADTFWWNAELYCRRRRSAQLRDLRRQAARARQGKPDQDGDGGDQAA